MVRKKQEEVKRVCGALPGKKDVRDYKLKKATVVVNFPDKFECPQKTEIKNRLDVGSCHDKYTEVLTKNGWKLFEDITYNDELATADPDNGNIIFERPTNIIKYLYDGDLIVGKHSSSLDFAVTPNHNMVVREWDHNTKVLSEKYSFVKAGDLGWWSGLRTEFHHHNNSDTFIKLDSEHISNGNFLPDVNIPMSLWVKFLGIYLAEGCSLKDTKKYNYRIEIAGVKDRERCFIKTLLNDMGLKYVTYDDRFTMYNKRLWNKLNEYGLVGVYSYEKFVPDFIFDLDECYIKDFLYGFYMGDGCLRSTGKYAYYTSSPYLADQIQILGLLSGEWINYHIDPLEKLLKKKCTLKDGRYIVAKRDQYTLWELKDARISIARKKCIRREKYSDYVYCAEVPTYHTLFTRRNGVVLFSGNCVGHSTAELIECFNPGTTLSTNFIYGLGHTKLFGLGIDENSPGMYLRSAANIAIKLGDPDEELCKGNNEVTKCTEIAGEAFINTDVIENASKHRIKQYVALQSISDYKYALINCGPVLFAIDWYEDNKLDRKFVMKKGSIYAGGHCMLMTGYDNSKGWRVQNSWGEDWGDKGYFWLPFDYGISEGYSLIPEDKTAAVSIKKPNWFIKTFGKLINKFLLK